MRCLAKLAASDDSAGEGGGADWSGAAFGVSEGTRTGEDEDRYCDEMEEETAAAKLARKRATPLVWSSTGFSSGLRVWRRCLMESKGCSSWGIARTITSEAALTCAVGSRSLCITMWHTCQDDMKRARGREGGREGGRVGTEKKR